MIDSVSGFFVQSEGPVSFNPIVCQFIASPLVGVREAMNDERRAMNVGATIVRGVLFVPVSSFTLHSSLFSLSGQKVMALHPGANDVRALAPGVYFVRAVSRELSAVSCHKVVIQR
jgi:hypothetical protein